MRTNIFLSLFLLSFLAVQLLAQNTNRSSPAIQERIINVDFSKTAGTLNTFFKECVGAGRTNEGLRADWQQQLAYVRKECGFKYIRMHGLLTDDMAVYKEIAILVCCGSESCRRGRKPQYKRKN